MPKTERQPRMFDTDPQTWDRTLTVEGLPSLTIQTGRRGDLVRLSFSLVDPLTDVITVDLTDEALNQFVTTFSDEIKRWVWSPQSWIRTDGGLTVAVNRSKATALLRVWVGGEALATALTIVELHEIAQLLTSLVRQRR